MDPYTIRPQDPPQEGDGRPRTLAVPASDRLGRRRFAEPEGVERRHDGAPVADDQGREP